MHKIKTEKYMLQALLNIKKISIFCKKLSFDFNLKQPNLILLPLIGLISGILFQNKWFFSTITLLITTTGVIICTLIAYLFLKYFKKQLILISTLSLTFLMGALSLNINQKIMFNIYKSIPRKNLDLVGTIISKRKNQHPQIREILTLNVQQIKEENNQTFNKTKLKIICYLEKTSNLEPDDKISFNNIRISTPKKETNLSGNNNFQDFLIKEKLAGSIFAKKIEPKLLYRPKYSSRRWFSRRTEQILQSLRRKLSWQSLSLLSCLFLGNKKQGYLKIKRHQFNYWGITHYLARSGIHVVLLVIVWKMLLGLLPIPLHKTHLIICFKHPLLSLLLV